MLVVARMLRCWNAPVSSIWRENILPGEVEASAMFSQTCNLCLFFSPLPPDPSYPPPTARPDEANENESSGSLNNQLSWKQGRQLLRQ